MIPTDYNEKRKMTRIINNVPLPEASVLTLDDLEWDNGNHINLQKLKQHLRVEGKITLDAAIAISQRAAFLFFQEKNVLELGSPITMFGDIHGQYLDLIDRLDSLPSPTNNDTWLFLGDYVDRGIFGVEVILYLFSLKINYPNSVFLIRGNHECRHLTNAYNFKKECLGKYKSIDFYDQIMEAFDNLPLAAVVDGGNGHRFLCVHGGLSPDIKTIQDINNLNRFCEPPQSGPMCDLLWSDPLEDDTATNLQANEMDEWYAVDFFENENRGAGYIFGYSAVMDFLKTNNLSSIIRAHDVQRTGYNQLYMHCKEKNRRLPLVITIFSAPNYCGYYGNDAAILRLEPAVKTGNPYTEIENFENFEYPRNYIARSPLSDIGEKSEEMEDPEKSISGSYSEFMDPEYQEKSDTEEKGIDIKKSGEIRKKRNSVGCDEQNGEDEIILRSSISSDPDDDRSWEVETVCPPPSLDKAAEYFPRLIFTTYNWVLEVPFWLPTFENAFQYSIPLLTDKVQDFLSALNSLADPEPQPRPLPSPVIGPVAAAAKAAVAVIEHRKRTCNYMDVNEWETTRTSDSNKNGRVSDHIKSFESKRHPTILTSGDAMKRRKSVKALSGSFQQKFRLYLSVINSRFDQIKKDNRISECRPPISEDDEKF